MSRNVSVRKKKYRERTLSAPSCILTDPPTSQLIITFGFILILIQFNSNTDMSPNTFFLQLDLVSGGLIFFFVLCVAYCFFSVMAYVELGGWSLTMHRVRSIVEYFIVGVDD